MTRWHWWAIVAGVLAVCACICGLILSVRADVVQAPRLAVETRQLALDELRALRADLVHQAERARVEALALADRQASGIRADARAAVKDSLTTAGQKIDATLARVDRATETIEGVRSDLKPVLTHTDALVVDATNSWDDLYWDVKASVESATMAARGVAETSEAVGKAAPQLAESAANVGKSAESIGQSAAGIAADVKREADEITAPKRWYQKLLGPVYTVGRLVAAFL